MIKFFAANLLAPYDAAHQCYHLFLRPSRKKIGRLHFLTLLSILLKARRLLAKEKRVGSNGGSLAIAYCLDSYNSA